MADIEFDFIVPFVKATDKIFESMVGIQVSHRQVYVKKGCRMLGEITAIIGLSGSAMGMCSISLTVEFAARAVGKMIYEDLPADAQDMMVRDGVGELINMIAGQAKALLSRTKYKFDITLPTIVSGVDHEVYYRRGTQCIVILFETEDGIPFTIEICHPEAK